MAAFEKDLKLRFYDVDQPYNIKFGREQDNDPKAGIIRGRIFVKRYVDRLILLLTSDGHSTISRNEIKDAFERCIPSIINSLEEQIEFRGIRSQVSLNTSCWLSSETTA
jgi:hypothetical protein